MCGRSMCSVVLHSISQDTLPKMMCFLADKALGTASLHLGLLYLDGEGVRIDKEASIRHLSIAGKVGNADAASTYGYLVRTGQYGP